MNVWYLLFTIFVLPNLLFIFIVWREEKKVYKVDTSNYIYEDEDEDDVIEW